MSKKFYMLVEFPYPSGIGLHLGHAFTFTGGDIYARFQRMQGKEVLFPMGFDAFGLPTENYAIRARRKPQEVTAENTAAFRRQMDELGLSFDWSRAFSTTDPDYYRWTQWIFVQLYKHGLAHKQEMPINWCPSCKVGLANEEVVDGHCERCGAETTRRMINQWVVKITAYAERLLSGLDQTEFIDKVKAAQVDWIRKSEGARIPFVVGGIPEPLDIFTTRPDTLWGCTFLVLAPEHPLVIKVLENAAVAEYVRLCQKKSDRERGEIHQEVSGVFSGLTAIHPATGEHLPVWIADFVLPSYGSGAIMAVPAHDQRDFRFARQYGLPVRVVVEPEGDWDFAAQAYEAHEGSMVASGPLDGLSPHEAVQKAIQWLEANGLGSRSVSYHLRDWIFSRQHYWGEPIPMVLCPRDGWVPVPEDQLPVVLPEVDRYEPTDTGESPLAKIKEWVNTTCPVCGGQARRETDTMPNWAGSDWYFLRYCDPHNDKALADIDRLRYWLPVDLYVGGDEHNNLHLLYSRFIYQFLHDIGAVPAEIPEPYRKRLSHGVVLGENGRRMAKTRGGVVQDEYVRKYGADTLRAYLMFMGPYDATLVWNENSLMGVKRFLDRFERFFDEMLHKNQGGDRRARVLVNSLAKQVGEDIAAFKFNTAIAKMMEALNTLNLESSTAGRDELAILAKILAPVAPFTAERCWKKKMDAASSVHAQRWPVFDASLEEDKTLIVAIQVNGKLRGTLNIEPGASQDEVALAARQVESVERHLAEKTIRRIIYAPGRTINFVVD
ncbi:MAG TPA: leucine--tRNA ligase [Anaerolinea sp.]|nr:leucine--tRNA ligase [Anaerolinea sp.]